MSTKHYSPLFLICYHRSGSTYSMRLLNSCDGLAVFGEHDGIFNHLAETAAKLRSRFDESKRSASVGLEKLRSEAQTEWIPYANPFSYESWLESTREYVKNLFASGLPDDVRWGFKEIRYRSIPTIQFMAELFPEAKFVFLQRERTDLLASNVRAPWVINPRVKENDGFVPPPKVRAHVTKVMRMIMSFEHTISHCSELLGSARSLVITYEEMNEQPEKSVRRIMSFLGEDPGSLVIDRLGKAKAAEIGTEVKKDEKYQPMFARDNLKKIARNYLHAAELGVVEEWIKNGVAAFEEPSFASRKAKLKRNALKNKKKW